MSLWWKHGILPVAAGLLLTASAQAGESGIPEDSVIAGGSAGWQRMLLNPMEDAISIKPGAWKMTGTYVAAAEQVPAKLGRAALTLGAAHAEQAGSKGDFTVRGEVPGQTRAIGAWIHLADGCNVASLGVQLYDAQGEVLLLQVPADWTGWKWIEVDLGDAVQAYPQSDKNRMVDCPLQSVQLIWFTENAGRTFLTADSIVALSRLPDASDSSVLLDWSVPEMVDAGGTLPASVSVTNFTEDPAQLTIRYSLRRDSSLYSEPIPHPVFGSDHAAGSRSWLVVDDEIIQDTSSTDGKPWTAATTPWQQDHYQEAFQFVDLGQVREIHNMTWSSGDANHSWFVDVFASEDGKTFAPVPGLSNVDHHKKWGRREFPVQTPFKARVLKFRYRTSGGRENLIAFPSELGVYDGASDEVVALPKVGSLVEEGTISMNIPPQSFSVRVLEFEQPVDSGAYLLGWSVEGDGLRELSYRHVFSKLQEQSDLITSGSRIALNASHADLTPKLRELGVGFVRFENGKWPFVSTQPHRYSFTGDVAPWHVNLDQIFETYHEAGLGVLSYMFLTPEWASTAPDDAADKMRLSFPPEDLSLYGEFCFQMAARYGSRKHSSDVLLTADKRSGLDLVKYYEMWNEPNLNPSPKASWGGWAAPMDTYYEMMRFGAEAVKRADPGAVVTSAGYAGMTTDTIDRLRTYRYPDGKQPLDFVEVINVHFYSGQEPPETCKTDGNANVTSTTTFSENLRELVDWRDRHAPSMPIWMTETGYDSGGPFGTTEAIQAARLPRVVMLCLAGGVEKVFVYRESGSTPSRHACSGVLRNDFSRKPSWYTLGTLIRQLHGVSGGARRLPHPDENVWLMEWDAGGEPLLTVWTVDGKARLGVEMGPCNVIDSFGGAVASKGTADLQVTPYPLYLRDFATLEPLQQLREEFERDEAAKAARFERIAALRKYLFDFGSTEHIGRSNIEGHRTDYEPVLATTVWDEQRGYGFDKPAMRDDDQPWMGGQKLDRDGTRVRDHVFQFRVAPGQYDLALTVAPFNDQRQLTVTGVVGGPLRLDVPQKKNPMKALRITVSEDQPVIGIQLNNDYGHFRWISCVETLEP